MRCAWKELLGILPPHIRLGLQNVPSSSIQELRLRINAPPEVICGNGNLWLSGKCSIEDLNFVIHTASQYSPWVAATLAEGYLTAPGGHRIGICGEAIEKNGSIVGIKAPSSLCIRVAKDYPGIAEPAGQREGSILIIGAPGWGKTTLLRDLIRQRSLHQKVCVVDTRRELFPDGFDCGKRVDILTGCPKPQGIQMLLRTMSPDSIAVDEITAMEDCKALIQASYCGVALLATAHASSIQDLHDRSVYRPLVEQEVFPTVLVLRKDKSYLLERMER